MWESAPTLSAIGTIGVYVALGAALASALAGAVSSIASSKANDIIVRESNERIANADRRAAEANARAEQARLEIARVNEGFAWRHLSPAQSAALIAALRGKNLEIWTTFVSLDPEAANFRNQIDGVLQEAGVKTHYFAGWEQATGLSLLGEDTPERSAFAEAFEKAGIPITVKPPHQGRGKKCPWLLVGTKPERL